MVLLAMNLKPPVITYRVTSKQTVIFLHLLGVRCRASPVLSPLLSLRSPPLHQQLAGSAFLYLS